ncbi:Uncharacterised protein [Nocardia cyriacigeorgica]|uniref:Uncharacterized protein n=1 Tax=Nocardia cyriacigeorgica TaxID=135487 RepID=A0A4V6IBY3_9NOCA|nr:Uncharacterised protein [Nocardia cyriacigeorgica]
MSGAPAWSPAPAAGATVPPPQVPGSRQDAYAQGARIGELYGQFDAWVDKLSDLFDSSTLTGGVRLWDRLSPEERSKALLLIKRGVESLPALPKPARADLAAALREGFVARRRTSYEAARFLNRAVWVACELAMIVVIDKAATPSPSMIGSIVTRNRDCAAHTASIVIREVAGHDVAAERLVKIYGLPPESMYGFKDAMKYAIQWFEAVGFRFAEKLGGFAPARQGGQVGRYVLFFERPNGGHVVYGEVTNAELVIIDGQAGKQWTNVAEAQRAINGELKRAQRIVGVDFP